MKSKIEENSSNQNQICFVWNEAIKKYVVIFKFAAYSKEIKKEEAIENFKKTVDDVLNYLKKSYDINSEDITYRSSTIYNIGDRIDNAHEIEDIYFNVPYSHIIYKAKDENGVRFELFTDPLKAPDTSVLSLKISEIYNLISYDERNEYLGRIAQGIHEYLMSNLSNVVILDKLKEDIVALKEKREKIKYVFSCAVCVAVVWILDFIILHNNIDSKFFDIAAWASLGGFLSITISSAKVNIEVLAPKNFYIKTGVIRTFVAIIGGSMTYLAVKSNFILGVFSDSLYGLFLLAIVSGFSENIITVILKKVKSQIDNN